MPTAISFLSNAAAVARGLKPADAYAAAVPAAAVAAHNDGEEEGGRAGERGGRSGVGGCQAKFIVKPPVPFRRTQNKGRDKGREIRVRRGRRRRIRGHSERGGGRKEGGEETPPLGPRR